MPKNISSEKQRLTQLIKLNKEEYDNTVSKLQNTEHLANETNKKLKLEEVRLNEFREEKIRIEGIISTHNETIKQLTNQVNERLNISLENLYKLANINSNKPLPSPEDLEKKLDRLISEQERLGGVNLLAEQEAEELDEKVNMWVNILNIDRSSENFMKGTGSLWYNFTPANQKNQEQENIRARLDRIKEFYEDKEGAAVLADEFNVEYVENDPE